MTAQDLYNLGYQDAIKQIAEIVDSAAATIELTTRDTITRQSDGKSFRVITKTGNPEYAKRLREFAAELRTIIQ